MNRHHRKSPPTATHPPASQPADASAMWREFSEALGLHRLCDSAICRRVKTCRGKGAVAGFRCWDAARAAVKRQIEEPEKDVEQRVAEYRAKLERMMASLGEEPEGEPPDSEMARAESDESSEEILETPAVMEARETGPRARVM